MKTKARWLLGMTLGTAAVAGCKADGDAPREAQAPPAAAPASPVRTALGKREEAKGRTIVITMETDETGNRFVPSAVTAKEGDVLRFVVGTGVHNVHFPAETNPGVQGLPPASELFNTPGHTREYVVGLGSGTYHFQCDPHAALGMVGVLTVQ